MTDEIPDWAKDENDLPEKMWDKKKDSTGKTDPVVSDKTDSDECESSKDESDPKVNVESSEESMDNDDPETDKTDSVEDKDDAKDDESEDKGEDPVDDDPKDTDGSDDKDPVDDKNDESEDEDDDGSDDDDSDDDGESDTEDDDESEDEDEEGSPTEPPRKDDSEKPTLDEVISDKDGSDKDENGDDENKEPPKSEDGAETPDPKNNGSKGRHRWSLKSLIPHPIRWICRWLNGTEEHPLPVFSLRARFRRWRLIKWHGYVWLRTMSYDSDLREYVLHQDLVRRRDVPKSAVHCSGEKNTYFHALFSIPYEPWKDNGFGAMNAYLYMRDTSIDEALLLLWSGQKSISMKTLAIIGIVLIAGLFYIYYMMQG